MKQHKVKQQLRIVKIKLIAVIIRKIKIMKMIKNLQLIAVLIEESNSMSVLGQS